MHFELIAFGFIIGVVFSFGFCSIAVIIEGIKRRNAAIPNGCRELSAEEKRWARIAKRYENGKYGKVHSLDAYARFWRELANAGHPGAAENAHYYEGLAKRNKEGKQ